MIFQGCGSNAAAPSDDDAFADWVVDRMILDSEFLFKQKPPFVREVTFVPYMTWEALDNNAPLTVNLFYESIIDLVAFRDGHIYTLAISHETMLDNSLENSRPYTFISQINYTDRYIDLMMYASGARPFGGIDFAHYIRFNHERNITTLYYVESRPMNGHIWSRLITIPWRIDDSSRVSTSPYERRPDTWQCESPRHPFISYSDEYIILNYIEDNSYVLGYIRYDDPRMRFTEVVRYDFTVDEDMLMTGRIPIYATADSHGIYFQVITLDGEHLDFGGESKLYFFCFESRIHERILHMDDSITYINGRNGILVYNYYSVDNPRAMTGRIVHLDDNWSVTIPHVTPVNDIIFSAIEDEFIFIVTTENIIAYNLQTREFLYVDVNSLSNGLRSNIRMSGNQFGWLSVYDDSTIVFYRIHLK